MTFLLDAPWILFLAVCFLLFTASTAGYRLAMASRVNEDSHNHEQTKGLREGLFVLLGLLLGFTLAMALPRFDRRRELVIEEANAIGTTMLRAQMLPEPQRGKTLELLREYVVVRTGFAQAEADESALRRTMQQTKNLQEQIWRQIVAVTQQDQNAVIATYIQTLNETIDISEQRLAEFENRVPKGVWIIITVVAVFESFVTGYSLRQKFWLSLVITPLVVAVVVMLIADLDSPRRGLIRIEQNSMDRLAAEVTGAKR
jgi:hypothetical protein